MKQLNHVAPETSQTNKQQGFFFGNGSIKYHLIILVVLCAAIYFFRLGSLPFLGPDEPRYAQVAREMFESGDWITPRLAGLHWFEKPALLYWISATGYTIFGVSEFAARFGVALMASLAVLILYVFGRSVSSARYGYLSAATLATSGLWIGFGQAATFDMPLAVSITIALASFFAWDQKQEQAISHSNNLLWFVSCFGMGLAVLAKGLVGVLLPAMIIGLYLLITGRLLALLKRPSLLLFGALVFLATTATWYVPMYLRNGQEFINEFFIAHHFQRFLTNKYRHPQPFYFFFFVAFVGCFPWLWFFGQQIVDSIKHWREILKAQNQRLRLFLWLWTLIPIIFFSLSTSKLTGYILPVFPAIALLIGLELDKLWQGTETLRWRWVHLLTPLLMLIVSIGVGLKADDELAVSSRTTWIVGGLGIAVSITHLFLLLRNVRTATLFLPFAMAAMMVATKLMFLPGLAYVESTRDLALTAARSVRPGERLIFFINNHFSIDFYATDLPLRDEKSYLLTLMKPKEIEDLMKSQPTQSLLVISRERWSPGLTELMQAEELGKQGELVLLRVRPK